MRRAPASVPLWNSVAAGVVAGDASAGSATLTLALRPSGLQKRVASETSGCDCGSLASAMARASAKQSDAVMGASLASPMPLLGLTKLFASSPEFPQGCPPAAAASSAHSGPSSTAAGRAAGPSKSKCSSSMPSATAAAHSRIVASSLTAQTPASVSPHSAAHSNTVARPVCATLMTDNASLWRPALESAAPRLSRKRAASTTTVGCVVSEPAEIARPRSICFMARSG
mmetsp:Transcript_14416/g.31571  ORF Transcript_14416/g.31571 Transcript_14416/m.31571 type:complete len:228 (+) Transcript_14416:764-1447(+)